MKKIAYVGIPLQTVDSVIYPVKGNKFIEYDKKVAFPLDAVLAKTMKKSENVKVVRIITESQTHKEIENENCKKQQEELNEINKKIGANIEYVDVVEKFDEEKSVQESRFRQLIKTLEQKSELYVDITYGPKTLPIIMFCVLHFAEKFFDADIKNIVYGKVEFDKIKKQSKPETAEMYDITSLHYLDMITSTMEAKDGKTAISNLDGFFAL